LRAQVPEYGEIRTFAVERIERLALRDERCDAWTVTDTFAHSLGAYAGKPERVQILVEPELAEYVSEREWHPSQRLYQLQGGSLVLDMHVSIDMALRRWILGLGKQARVLAPIHLAEAIREELESASERYVEQPTRSRTSIPDVARQQTLPFGELRVLMLVGERVA
jgi:predicted DNA-binding transcriptional regulator YafY